MDQGIKNKIREYLADQYFKGQQDELTDDTPLLSSGIVDSISALQLVEFLESEFNFEFEAHEVDQDNLKPLETIDGFVSKKPAAQKFPLLGIL